MSNVAYFPTVDDNPNFVSRPPDPGLMKLYGTTALDALYHSPFSGTKRFSEMMLEKSDYFNVDGVLLNPKEATDKYGLGGQLTFDEPIKESAAELMMRRKIAENDRAYIMNSGATSGMRAAGGIAVGMGATLIDPINFASMFVPVVGEVRFARMVTRFGGSVTKARLASGAIEGAVGAAMVEPFVLLPAIQEQANYTLEDSGMNLMFGAALGGFLHAGLGAVGDRLKAMKPHEKDAIFEAAMNNILKDEPVIAPAKLESMTESVTTREASQESFIRQMEQTTSIEPVTPVDFKLADLIGKDVEYAGYSGKLIRDDEGNFVVLREVTLNGEPNYIEVSGTGKDPEMLGAEVGVLPKGTEVRAKQLREEKVVAMKEQISSDRIRKEQQGQNLNKDIQKDIPRSPQIDSGDASVQSKLLNDITKEADELETSLDRRIPIDDDERIEFEAQKQQLKEQLKAEIGNPKAREDGVNAAIACITRNRV